MKQTMLKAVSFLAVLVLFGCAFAACKKETALSVTGLETIHETEFGGVYIRITIDDFNRKGFAYGDSVDVEFSNGYKLEDIPYYNGYYVDAGEALLIAYPGYDYVKAAINYGEDLWEKAELQQSLPLQAAAPEQNARTDLFLTAALDGHSTASIKLRERGKYLDIQNARDIHYRDEREEFPSDEVFANFRNMTAGQLKPGAVYRSASPCDNQHNRAPYVDRLIADAGIRCILDLADNDAKIRKYITSEDFDSPYFLSLYESGQVVPLALNMNYLSEEFRRKIAEGFIVMSESEGPYLIHCTEGKDRTGFVCMLIEALAGASYQEIADDYMLTYDNYYKITEKSDKAKYDVILEKNLVAMLKTVVGNRDADLEKTDLSLAARAFLKGSGMTDDEIDRFLDRIR
ncbi:MAG: tyrosine-protein phosphatase [Lachnospiraceae bacterium]|nr:tyrosine-protein phosphatase [Lachnospiraceae bacterium]